MIRVAAVEKTPRDKKSDKNSNFPLGAELQRSLSSSPHIHVLDS
jgi:hypothetical protein